MARKQGHAAEVTLCQDARGRGYSRVQCVLHTGLVKVEKDIFCLMRTKHETTKINKIIGNKILPRFSNNNVSLVCR